MKKLFLEIFIFLAVFFSAYFFIFQEGSTTGGRALFSAIWLFLLCCYLLFIKQFKAAEILGLKEILERVETLEKEKNTFFDKITAAALITRLQTQEKIFTKKIEEIEKHIFEISGPSKKRAEQINTKLDSLSLGHEEICERFREFEKRLNTQTETSENFIQLLENYSDRIRNLESEINLIQEQIKPIKK